jgi:uncharacterized protein DUF4365
MKPSYRAVYVHRRSELMAELFLQQLGPVARSTPDLGYDFLVTVKNRKGGANTFGVQVKGTESGAPSSFEADRDLYRSLTLSNIPGFLLVADVKKNKLFYGWPDRAARSIPLHEADDERVSELRKRLVDWSQSDVIPDSRSTSRAGRP